MIGNEISDNPSAGEITAVSKFGSAQALIDLAEMKTNLIRLCGADDAMVDSAQTTISYQILHCRAPNFAATVTSPQVNLAESAEAVARFIYWCKFGIFRAASIDIGVQLYLFAAKYKVKPLCKEILLAVGEARDLWPLTAALSRNDLPADLWEAFADAFWKAADSGASSVMPDMPAETCKKLLKFRIEG